MITLPNEYLSLSDDRLFAIAKIMYDRSVSALFYSKDYNENFFQDEDEIRLMIDMFLCSMCRVDGDINEKEKSFLSFLDAQCSDPEMASELSTAFDNNVAELLPFFSANNKLVSVARDIIRLIVIAAVIDNRCLNSEENDFLIDRLNGISI